MSTAARRRADFSRIEDSLSAAVASGRVPGVVAAVTSVEGVIYEAAVGLASTAAHVEMRPETVFRIASMTKLVTAIAVMILREEGKLGLDDPLVRHLPGFRQPGVLVSFDERKGEYAVREAKRAITIRDLLTHTSGFGYWFLNRELFVEAKGRIEHFDAPFLMHDPGERFTYGISTDVLGLAVESASGVPLDRFIAERVARPLGMCSTGFEPPADSRRLAAVHRRRGARLADGPNERAEAAPRGGGGLYSTAGDYLAVLRMLLNRGRLDDGRPLLTEESIGLMTTNQIGHLTATLQRSAFPRRSLDFVFLDGTQKFGFNVMLETRDRAAGRRAGSYGWAGIFNTYFWVDPASGIGALLLMQMSPFCDPGCIAVYRAFERAVYAALAEAA